MSQTAGNSNSQNVKYCGEIQIPKMSKSAGKFELKFLKSQKLREIPIPKRQKVWENSNSPNLVAIIIISYILCALVLNNSNEDIFDDFSTLCA